MNVKKHASMIDQLGPGVDRDLKDGGRVRDERPAALSHGDDPRLAELRKRLTHGQPVDLELLDQGGLGGKPLTGSPLAGVDLVL